MRSLLLAALVVAAPAFGQQAPPPDPKPADPAAAKPAEPASSISGLLFGDYYYFGSSHDPDFDGQHGFWLRRGYLTFDHGLSPTLSLRFRLEVNSSGDMTDTRLTPYVKDAYVRWSRGSHALVAGMSPTPTFDLIESVWGYRFLEKTPLDLQRWGATRDLGIAATGTLDEKKTLHYSVMFGNGSDTGSEVNTSKAVRGAFSYRATSGFAIEGYADWQDQPDDADRSTLQVFGGYRKPGGRFGVQYAHQTRRSAGGASRELDLFSAFAIARIADRHWAIARVDRMFDPNPDGARIPYLPFHPEADAMLAIVGWDIVFGPNVHAGPNVEFVKYGKVGGLPVRSDAAVRLTLYVEWP